MKVENQKVLDSTNLAQHIGLCFVVASALSALACVCAVDEGPCGPTAVQSIENECTASAYEPNNSYCDSRDDRNGGADCTVATVDCIGYEFIFEKEYGSDGKLCGCGGYLGEGVPPLSTAHIAVVTGSCTVY